MATSHRFHSKSNHTLSPLRTIGQGISDVGQGPRANRPKIAAPPDSAGTIPLFAAPAAFLLFALFPKFLTFLRR
jgi:hypothetical protein